VQSRADDNIVLGDEQVERGRGRVEIDSLPAVRNERIFEGRRVATWMNPRFLTQSAPHRGIGHRSSVESAAGGWSKDKVPKAPVSPGSKCAGSVGEDEREQE
jgi:hypothetical protein